jgi:hypothetical protein
MEMRMQGEKGESGRQCAVRNTASFIPAMIQAHDLIVATSNSESEKRGKKVMGKQRRCCFRTCKILTGQMSIESRAQKKQNLVPF